MATISYQLRPAFASNYGGGVIFVDNFRSFDVKAALTAGSGTIVADAADRPLIYALDLYPPLYRTGSSPGGTPPTTTINQHIVVARQDPAIAGQVPVLNADGTWSAGGASAADAVAKTIVDAKGDILTGSAPDTVTRLPAGSDGQVLTANSTTSTGLAWSTATPTTPIFPVTFSSPGTLAVTTGQARFRLPVNATLIDVAATVGTAPTGASIKVDVNANGTTVFTTQANRPTIAIAGNVSSAATPNTTAFAAGAVFTVDIDQVGSTVAGADLTVTLSFQGSASAPTVTYADTVGSTPGIVSYWKLDEPSGTAAADSIGSNPGTYVGSPTLNQSSLVTGGVASVSFNGSTQYVAITGTASLQPSNATLEAWINVPSITSKNLSTIADGCFGIGGDGGGHAQVFFWNGSVNRTAVGATVLSASTLYHVVGVWDDTTKDLKIYLNGVQDGTNNFAAQSIAWTASNYVSAIAAGTAGAAPVAGKLDDVAFYNTPLSAATILAHYNKGLSG